MSALLFYRGISQSPCGTLGLHVLFLWPTMLKNNLTSFPTFEMGFMLFGREHLEKHGTDGWSTLGLWGAPALLVTLPFVPSPFVSPAGI